MSRLHHFAPLLIERQLSWNPNGSSAVRRLPRSAKVNAVARRVAIGNCLETNGDQIVAPHFVLLALRVTPTGPSVSELDPPNAGPR